MKQLLLLFCSFSIVLVREFVSGKISSIDEEKLNDEWNTFKKLYNKTYMNNETDERRKEIFKKNYNMIEEHNANRNKTNVTFSMRMNKFGDLNHSEFLTSFSYKPRDIDNPPCHMPTSIGIDEENDEFFNDPDNYQCKMYGNVTYLNWTELGAVYEVKDQGECKSGWAYSTIDAIRGRLFVLKNLCCNNPTWVPPALSVEFLMNCSNGTGNCLCKCGYAHYAFDLLNRSGGVPNISWDSWNSNSEENKCNTNLSKVREILVPFKVKANSVSITNKGLTMKFLKEGPMPVFIRANAVGFQFANGGVYHEEVCNEVPNHEVLLVGYGIDSETHLEYWLVKNSFGESWGDNGYLKIEKRNDTKSNCSVLFNATRPFIEFTQKCK